MTHLPSKTTLLLSAFTLGTSLLAACGEDPAPAGDASFAEMSAAEREQAIRAAAGGVAITPYFVMFGADLDSVQEAGCPAREQGEGVLTLTGGGCTTAEGTTYDGVLIARNVPSLEDAFGDPQVDATKPMSIELDSFRVGLSTFDGLFEQSTPMPGEGEMFTTSVAYTISGGAGAGSFELESDCANRTDGRGNPCTVSGLIDVTAQGSYHFDGTFALGTEEASGWLELRGADTLRVDFDAAVDGCAPYTIDGAAAGELCFAPPPSEAPPLDITGGGGGCGSDGTTFTYDFVAWVIGDAERVDITLHEALTGASETHAMTHESFDEGNSEHTWSVVLEDADTAFTCSGEELTYKVTAYDAEGASVCHALGANPEIFEAEGCEVF